MQDGSRKSRDDRSFIGFWTDPELKEKATQQAQEEGVCLSEWMRQLLREAQSTSRDEAALA